MSRRPRTQAAIAALALAGFALGCLVGCTNPDTPGSDPSPMPTHQTPSPADGPQTLTAEDSKIERLYQAQASDVEVTGAGTVVRLLSDDDEGDRHQRFILELDSGLTLLVAHNIDLSDRLVGIEPGDRVGFHGEYVYTDQGGTIHWTHRDPDGSHEPGWLDWRGRRYD